MSASAELPWSTPEGLRHATPDDVPALSALWTDPVVRRHLGGPVPADLARQRAADHVLRPGAFVIGERLGLVVLSPHASGVHEVSYQLHPTAWGQGHAATALRATLAWAFDQAALPQVIAVTQTSNARSLALLARVGMRLQAKTVEHSEPQTVLVAVPDGRR